MNQTTQARKQIERRLAPLRSINIAAPPRGWLRAIREALGMTTVQFAQRLGVTQPRIIALEKAETNGTASLKTLREAAEALDCTLVYAIVPTKQLDDLLRDQAIEKTNQELERLSHTMRLENQEMTPSDLEDERQRMIAALLSGSPRRVWDRD